MNVLRALSAALFALILVAGISACGDDDDGPGAGAQDTPAVDGGGEDDGQNGDSGDDDGGGSSPAPTDSGGGTGSSPELEEYFRVLEEISARTDTGLEEAGAGLDQTFETEEQEVDALREAIRNSGEVLEQSLLDVGQLDPPDEVTGDHESFRDALSEVVRLTAEVLDAIEDVTTSQEMEDLILNEWDPVLTEADNAFSDACFALQDVAATNGITVDLRCD